MVAKINNEKREIKAKMAAAGVKSNINGVA
jgi:hypothetical protein